MLAAEMWPAADRPYIGGSTNNSVLNLIINGNGYDRVFGTNSVAPPGVGAALSAPTSGTAVGGDDGLGRLFNSANGDQVSWLIPAALLALVLLVWLTARSPRTDRTRAALMLWGGWMLVTAASFSLISIHTYYTIALAPAIAALVGIGAVELWKRRTTTLGRFGLAGMIALTGMWSAVLLHRVSWQPWLIGAVIAAAVIATAAMLLTTTRSRQLTTVALLTAGITGLLGSGAYAVQTVATPRVGIGGLPVAGPGQDQRSINPFGAPPPGASPASGAQPPAAGQPSPAGAYLPAGRSRPVLRYHPAQLCRPVLRYHPARHCRPVLRYRLAQLCRQALRYRPACSCPPAPHCHRVFSFRPVGRCHPVVRHLVVRQLVRSRSSTTSPI